MTRKYSIRKMVESEVQIAIDWAKQEGWNPGIHDAHRFFQADKNGFFIGLLDEEPIAVGAGIIYDQGFAFCGLYIVKPQYRKQGYGIQLTKARLDYIGNRVTGLDGVLENVSKYERLGYERAYPQTRYALTSPPVFPISPNCLDLAKIPFDVLDSFDKNYFPGSRSSFLREWIKAPNTHAIGCHINDTLEGYGVIRKCYDGYKIGPLFATSLDIAHDLFKSLIMKVTKGPIFLDIPEANERAITLVKHYGMTPVFQVIRMYRNGFPKADLNGIYGITSFELG